MNLEKQARIDEAIDALNGVFPGAGKFNYLFSGTHGYATSNWSQLDGFKRVCTRAEFEASKAERQNKPSWDKAPAWVNWAAQDEEGRWFWYSKKPEVDGLEFVEPSDDGKVVYASPPGEVIGDWRNTLEQRPNQIHPTGDIGRSSGTVGANHIGESDGKGCADAAIEAMRDIRTAFAKQAVSQFKASARYIDKHPCGLSKVEVTVESGPSIDFEWLANQFHDVDDINAVWALRDKLHRKNKPEPSPELSFHLSNAFNELQASARLLPEDDPRRAQIVALAGGVGAVKEVA